MSEVRLKLREDRPTTIEEHRALRAEIERLRAMLDEALYSIGTDDYEAQKILASDIKKRLVEQKAPEPIDD